MITDEQHREMGRLLGFPSCCVEYWIKDKTGAARRRGCIEVRPRTEAEIGELIRQGLPRKVFYNPVNGNLEDPNMKYVPCPDCIGKPGWRPMK